MIGAVLDCWQILPDWKLGSTPTSLVSLEDVANHIDHICQLAGNARHAGIGSDLDGGSEPSKVRTTWRRLRIFSLCRPSSVKGDTPIRTLRESCTPIGSGFSSRRGLRIRETGQIGRRVGDRLRVYQPIISPPQQARGHPVDQLRTCGDNSFMNFNDTEIVAFVRENLYVAAVCDILDELGYRHQAMHQRLRPLLPDRKNCGFVGRARTVRWMETDNIREDNPYGIELEAMDSLKPGTRQCIPPTTRARMPPG